MSKKVLPIVLTIVLIATLIFLPKIDIGGIILDKPQKEEVFLELWHVDSFSGGKNSRAEFLKSVAVKFNKKYANVFIVVKNLTVESFLEKLEGKDLPDMISFGSNLGEYVFPKLGEYGGGIYTFDNFTSAMMVEGKSYGVVWAFSGYFFLGEGKTFEYGSQEGCSALTALYFSEKVKSLDTHFVTLSSLSQDKAYEKFLDGKTSIIGTNREVVKAQIRMDDGRLSAREIVPLNGFADLMQCIGITKNATTERTAYSTKFIEYLCSEACQKGLSELRLFSATRNDVYNSPPFSEFEKGIESILTTNAFTPISTLKQNDELALKAIYGEERYISFIEKLYRN